MTATPVTPTQRIAATIELLEKAVENNLSYIRSCERSGHYQNPSVKAMYEKSKTENEVFEAILLALKGGDWVFLKLYADGLTES